MIEVGVGNKNTDTVREYRKNRLKTDPQWATKYRARKNRLHREWEQRALSDDRASKVAADKKLRQSKNKRKARRAIKLEVMNHYGGKCTCCGEDILEFLTIDHINGGGRAHRASVLNQPKRERGGGGCDFYAWLKNHSYPEGFQVMCWNCNCGRQYNGGVCPHKVGGLSF